MNLPYNPSALLRPALNPVNPRSEIIQGMPMGEYRAHPGFAPSDLKVADTSITTKGIHGHPLRLLERLQRIADGIQEESTEAQEDGTLYHLLVLEPELYEKTYVEITPDLIEGWLALARERKLPCKYSPHLTEAREWVKEHGRKPDETEQAAILAAARERRVEDVQFHVRLSEFTDWCDEQAKKGLTPIWPSSVTKYRRMADALYHLPQNAEAAAYLREMKPQARLEASIFFVARYTLPDEQFVDVQVKTRPDFLVPEADVLNLKSAISIYPGEGGLSGDFEVSAAKWNYPFSEGAAAWMLAQLGQPVERIGYLVQEKEPPHFAAIRWLPHDWANYGAVRFTTVLRQIIWAQHTGNWSVGDYNEMPALDNIGTTMLPPSWLVPSLDCSPNILPMAPRF